MGIGGVRAEGKAPCLQRGVICQGGRVKRGCWETTVVGQPGDAGALEASMAPDADRRERW